MFHIQSILLLPLDSTLTYAHLEFLFHGWSEVYHQEVIPGIKKKGIVKLLTQVT